MQYAIPLGNITHKAMASDICGVRQVANIRPTDVVKMPLQYCLSFSLSILRWCSLCEKRANTLAGVYLVFVVNALHEVVVDG